MCKEEKGFTLIELLIGITIAGAVIIIVFKNAPGLIKWVTKVLSSSTVSGKFNSPANFIPEDEEKTYNYKVIRSTSGGGISPEDGRKISFAVSGGLTVNPTNGETDGNGILTIKVKAPSGQGQGTLVATDDESSISDSPVNIEWGPVPD